jgi:hypothetical protein
MVQTEELSDGNWRAWYPGLEWSVTATAEDDAEAKAVQEAIGRREDPGEVARKVAATDRRPIELEPDDPWTKGVWRFTPQTEQRSDGTWRAWYPSGGWSVTGATEAEAKDKPLRESARHRSDPDEVARRVAIIGAAWSNRSPGCRCLTTLWCNPRGGVTAPPRRSLGSSTSSATSHHATSNRSPSTCRDRIPRSV